MNQDKRINPVLQLALEQIRQQAEAEGVILNYEFVPSEQVRVAEDGIHVSDEALKRFSFKTYDPDAIRRAGYMPRHLGQHPQGGKYIDAATAAGKGAEVIGISLLRQYLPEAQAETVMSALNESILSGCKVSVADVNLFASVQILPVDVDNKSDNSIVLADLLELEDTFDIPSAVAEDVLHLPLAALVFPAAIAQLRRQSEGRRALGLTGKHIHKTMGHFDYRTVVEEEMDEADLITKVLIDSKLVVRAHNGKSVVALPVEVNNAVVVANEIGRVVNLTADGMSLSNLRVDDNVAYFGQDEAVDAKNGLFRVRHFVHFKDQVTVQKFGNYAGVYVQFKNRGLKAGQVEINGVRITTDNVEGQSDNLGPLATAPGLQSLLSVMLTHPVFQAHVVTPVGKELEVPQVLLAALAAAKQSGHVVTIRNDESLHMTKYSVEARKANHYSNKLLRARTNLVRDYVMFESEAALTHLVAFCAMSVVFEANSATCALIGEEPTNWYNTTEGRESVLGSPIMDARIELGPDANRWPASHWPASLRYALIMAKTSGLVVMYTGDGDDWIVTDKLVDERKALNDLLNPRHTYNEEYVRDFVGFSSLVAVDKQLVDGINFLDLMHKRVFFTPRVTIRPDMLWSATGLDKYKHSGVFGLQNDAGVASGRDPQHFSKLFQSGSILGSGGRGTGIGATLNWKYADVLVHANTSVPRLLEDALLVAKNSGLAVEITNFGFRKTTRTLEEVRKSVAPLFAFGKEGEEFVGQYVYFSDNGEGGTIDWVSDPAKVHDLLQAKVEFKTKEDLLAGPSSERTRMYTSHLTKVLDDVTAPWPGRQTTGVEETHLGKMLHSVNSGESISANLSKEMEAKWEAADPGTAFARLFMMVMLSMKKTEQDLIDAVDVYITRQGSLNGREHAIKVVNLRKELTDERMSWKTFCIGLKVLGVQGFDLKVDMETESNQKFSAESMVDLSPEQGDERYGVLSHLNSGDVNHPGPDRSTGEPVLRGYMGGIQRLADKLAGNGERHFHGFNPESDRHEHLRQACIAVMGEIRTSIDEAVVMWGELFKGVVKELKMEDDVLKDKIRLRLAALYPSPVPPQNMFELESMTNALFNESRNEHMLFFVFATLVSCIGFQTGNIVFQGVHIADNGMDDLIMVPSQFTVRTEETVAERAAENTQPTDVVGTDAVAEQATSPQTASGEGVKVEADQKSVVSFYTQGREEGSRISYEPQLYEGPVKLINPPALSEKQITLLVEAVRVAKAEGKLVMLVSDERCVVSEQPLKIGKNRKHFHLRDFVHFQLFAQKESLLADERTQHQVRKTGVEFK